MEKRTRSKASDVAPGDADVNEAIDQIDAESEPLTDVTHADVAGVAAGSADADLYRRLATPFDVTFRDLRGGVELEYITGEQATTRLNETLGFLNWSFRVWSTASTPRPMSAGCSAS